MRSLVKIEDEQCAPAVSVTKCDATWKPRSDKSDCGRIACALQTSCSVIVNTDANANNRNQSQDAEYIEGVRRAPRLTACLKLKLLTWLVCFIFLQSCATFLELCSHVCYIQNKRFCPICDPDKLPVVSSIEESRVEPEGRSSLGWSWFHASAAIIEGDEAVHFRFTRVVFHGSSCLFGIGFGDIWSPKAITPNGYGAVGPVRFGKCIQGGPCGHQLGVKLCAIILDEHGIEFTGSYHRCSGLHSESSMCTPGKPLVTGTPIVPVGRMAKPER